MAAASAWLGVHWCAARPLCQALMASGGNPFPEGSPLVHHFALTAIGYGLCLTGSALAPCLAVTTNNNGLCLAGRALMLRLPIMVHGGNLCLAGSALACRPDLVTSGGVWPLPSEDRLDAPSSCHGKRWRPHPGGSALARCLALMAGGGDLCSGGSAFAPS